MAMGQGGAKGWALCPGPAWFYLAPFPPLGAPRSPASSRKTLLFVNLPYN